MANITLAAAATQLGLNQNQLLKAIKNPTFVQPVSNDGAGNILFLDTAVTAQAGKITTAKTNGWKLTDSDLERLNWTTAPAAPGAFYQPGALADPIHFMLGELGKV